MKLKSMHGKASWFLPALRFALHQFAGVREGERDFVGSEPRADDAEENDPLVW